MVSDFLLYETAIIYNKNIIVTYRFCYNEITESFYPTLTSWPTKTQ
jgi:hypothetical protein